MKLFLLILCFSFCVNAFPVPKDNKATFDIIRKNKIIGSAETIFSSEDGKLFVETNVNIEIKILFIPAYKFIQKSKEIWINGEFVEFEGYTDFEDDREYFIKGEDIENNFIASGMDGQLILNNKILPLNYWNKKILKEKKVFDTQKGIVRNISVKRIKDEFIYINDKKIITEKYLLDASTNPKDKGPFPQYTLWYAENDELIKFKFTNWKDKKDIVTQRNDW